MASPRIRHSVRFIQRGHIRRPRTAVGVLPIARETIGHPAVDAQRRTVALLGRARARGLQDCEYFFKSTQNA